MARRGFRTVLRWQDGVYGKGTPLVDWADRPHVEVPPYDPREGIIDHLTAATTAEELAERVGLSLGDTLVLLFGLLQEGRISLDLSTLRFSPLGTP
jgi:hypothetical protein